MTRKFFSALFLIVSLIVGLGALGHSHQWSSHVAPAIGSMDPHLFSLLELIWLWTSGTMLVFGVLLVWCWLRLRRGDTSLTAVPGVAGGFYILAGTCGAVWVEPFFWLFPVLGALLWLSTWMLRPAKP